MTCGRAREFLGRKRVEPRTTTDAKRERLGPREALALTSGTDELYVAKGKKVAHLDLRRSRPDRDALLGLLLGPSGNLRAPAMRVGKTLCIGFAPDMYQAVLG